jgi:hypothetical protein
MTYLIAFYIYMAVCVSSALWVARPESGPVSATVNITMGVFWPINLMITLLVKFYE